MITTTFSLSSNRLTQLDVVGCVLLPDLRLRGRSTK